MSSLWYPQTTETEAEARIRVAREDEAHFALIPELTRCPDCGRDLVRTTESRLLLCAYAADHEDGQEHVYRRRGWELVQATAAASQTREAAQE